MNGLGLFAPAEQNQLGEDALRNKKRELELKALELDLKEREQKQRLKSANAMLKSVDAELKALRKKDAYQDEVDARRRAAALEDAAKWRALARDEDDADARHKKRRLDDAPPSPRRLRR